MGVVLLVLHHQGVQYRALAHSWRAVAVTSPAQGGVGARGFPRGRSQPGLNMTLYLRSGSRWKNRLPEILWTEQYLQRVRELEDMYPKAAGGSREDERQARQDEARDVRKLQARCWSPCPLHLCALPAPAHFRKHWLCWRGEELCYMEGPWRLGWLGSSFPISPEKPLLLWLMTGHVSISE